MKVTITTEFITLGQFLKHADLVATGGQVKPFLESNTVLVNNQPTVQRGKKLYPGDSISIRGKMYLLVKR
ncbi:MAG: S4 domain-containing protein YaaA [Firmicutes bacterium]|nr:S4 domain-containing protein YaaA [Bacillota bacterium]